YDSGQALGSAATRENADPCLRQTDRSDGVPRDAKVAGERELESSAHAHAVDRRDDRLLNCRDQVGERMEARRSDTWRCRRAWCCALNTFRGIGKLANIIVTDKDTRHAAGD